MINNFSKTNWPTVKFGDVVKNANLTEKDPVGAEIERIVGLEHIDPENLHITRWNTPEDGTSFTRKFVPGQTLFGKRRAYQRKVAFAEFEGICSGDILTFETKDPKKLLPELLPFICQTEAFFDHALGTSAGSLSPRTSWKALKDFEFPLPPIDEQQRIAEIMWAADEAVTSYVQSKKAIKQTVQVLSSKFLNKGWKKTPLEKLLKKIQYGCSKEIINDPIDTYPILRIPNIISGSINLNNIGRVSLTDKEANKYKLFNGDVLIVRTNGNPNYVGRTAVVKQVPDNCMFASYLIRLSTETTLLTPEYLHVFLSSSYGRKTLRHEIRSSAGNYNLNTDGIKQQCVPLPPINTQIEFTQEIAAYQRKIDGIDKHISSLLKTSTGLLNNLLGV